MPPQGTAKILRFPVPEGAPDKISDRDLREPLDIGQSALTALIILAAMLQFAVAVHICTQFHT